MVVSWLSQVKASKCIYRLDLTLSLVRNPDLVKAQVRNPDLASVRVKNLAGSLTRTLQVLNPDLAKRGRENVRAGSLTRT